MIWRKPVFVLVLLCLLSQTGHSQATSTPDYLSKGTMMVGGSLGFEFSTDHQDHVNTGTFDFNPLFGAFVTKRFVLGIAPVIQYTKSSGGYSYIDSSHNPPQTVNITLSTSQTSLGLGPFARYYIPISSKVHVFVHASPSIMATWISYSREASSPIQRTISANWVLGPGLSVMLTRSVALEVSLYYQGMYHRSAQFVNGNLLGASGSPYVDNGMVLNVGFQVYLDKGKKKETTPAAP